MDELTTVAAMALQGLLAADPELGYETAALYALGHAKELLKMIEIEKKNLEVVKDE